MSESAQTSDPARFRFWRRALAVALAWTALIVVSLGWSLFEQRREILDNARHEARISFQQEMLIRFWQDNHGDTAPAMNNAPPSPDLTRAGKRVRFDSTIMRRQIQAGYEKPVLRSHLTSLKPLETQNLPDKWEADMLQAFAKEKTEVTGVATMEGQEYMRVMRPLVNEEICAQCHGTQDFKIGEIRGGMSVSVPLAPLRANARREFFGRNIAYGLLWVLGLGGIVFIMRRIQANALEQARSVAILRDSEVRYRTLADSGQALIWTSGTDKKCDYFNQPWLTFTGRTFEQERGDGWAEGVHLDDLDHCLQIYTTAFDRRERFSMDYRLRRHDGEFRWIQDNGTPRFDSRGNFLGYIGHCLDITERKQDEAQARQLMGEMGQSRQVLLSVIEDQKESAEQLRKLSRIVEQAPLSVVITDLAGAIEYVNPAFCAVTGYTVDAVLGRNPRVLKSGLTSPDVYRNLWQTLTRGKVWRGEFNNKKKNGELYDEQAVIAPVTDDTGKVTHYVALKLDITANKAAATALRESEERFRELFDLESDAILVTESGTGRIVQANIAASVIYGYTVAELLTMTNEDISAEPDQTRVTHAKATGQDFGKVVRVPLRLHRKRDGTSFPVDISVRAFGRGGQILAVLVIRDITEQEKIRETLERFNEELEKKVTLRTEELALRNSEIEALLASIPDLVMRLRDDGTVRDFQPAKGATPLGAVLVKMNERSVDDLMGPLTKVALPLGHRALTGKITVTAEAEVTLGGCPMVAEFRVTPIGNDEVVVFARDITERKRLDAAMAAMLEKSQQISEMKSRFISVTSHEFRTPMAAAMASTDLLHNHYDRLAPAKREEIFNRIDFSFHRMTEMLDDVLLLNRIDADRLKVQLAPVDLRDFTSAIVGEVRIGDHDTHLFELHATGDTAYFVTDVVLLRHILSNLLSNAAHYSPAGTVITTYLAVEPGRMLMTVEDHGIGVPEEDRERIFESFERGSNVGTIKGTGLGLDIVRRMTGMLGGTVRLESSVGGGSRFIVELPRAEIPEPAHS